MTAKVAANAARVRRMLWLIAGGVGFTVIVVVLLLWLAGTFHRKIDATTRHVEPVAERPVGPHTTLVAASLLRTPRI